MHAGSLLLFSAVLFNGSFSIILACVQMLAPRRNIINFIVALGFLCKAVEGIVGGLVALGAQAAFLWFAYQIIVPASFVSIASSFLYYRAVLDRSPSLRPSDALHAAIPALSIVAFALVSTGKERHQVPVNVGAASLTLIRISRYTAHLLTVGYGAALILKMRRLFGGASPEFRKVMLSIVGLQVGMFLLVVGWFLDRTFSLSITPVMYILFSPYLVLLLFFFLRYPRYFLYIREDAASAQNGRYARSRIAGLNTGEIMERLFAFMNEERVYRDSELSLGDLAWRLDIEPHQLSELLNALLGMAFLDFVNSYRVEEAKSILRNDGDRKVLDIALDIGFNSQSAFYNAFKKITGTTPADFRRREKSA